MKYLGIDYHTLRLPELDADFIPMGAWMRAYEAAAKRPVRIAIEAADGRVVTRETALIADGAHEQADYRYLERLVKFLLWSVGGCRVIVCGADALTDRLRRDYAPGGARAFDAAFMDDVFECGLTVSACGADAFPAARGEPISIGGHEKGCRIGFDAGGSDRKVSAVIDGEAVYSEEVVWHPKTQSDPRYHYEEIVAAFRAAAEKMPRVDGIGVSSAGVFVGNSPMVSALFLKVPRSERAFVKDIYNAAARAVGSPPIAVANDGDVTALAGAMELRTGRVMGLAMGTSEAVGYVDAAGSILGWFNELAFAPVDLNERAMADEWSGDAGVGCKYLSQDAVIKLAPAAGITLSERLTPAEKLSEVQRMLEAGWDAAAAIFRSIGVYLAHALALYDRFYEIRHLLLLGRVVSGEGGRLIESACRETLAGDYPELSEKIRILLPDEAARRVGQSVAAASLPRC
ncbi:MAG: ROK family protein [Clostridiales bacterium]|nr:ROK family protein [Clostridiales bacterium]